MDKQIYEKPVYWLADYWNELMRVGFALARKNNYTPEIYKKREIKNLTKYMEGDLRRTVKKETPKEDTTLFWRKKKRLDILVKELNEGFKKDRVDEIHLKKLFNEVAMIIWTPEAPTTHHTPFSEVAT